MKNEIRERIDLLKKRNGIEKDQNLILRIYEYKKINHDKDIKNIGPSDYLNGNKGSYSKYFNGERSFRLEDYLAIESALNTSMAYIIKGKGAVSDTFEPKGIRYAAYTDTIGNYEQLICDNIQNSTDEYNKSLIDYMIEYESKNGFEYFAERDMLPFGTTGGNSMGRNCLCFPIERNKEVLRAICKLLPAALLKKYFDGFLSYGDVISLSVDEARNTSFTDEVLEVAILNDNLRRTICETKQINLDEYNPDAKRSNGQHYGNGLFVNYALTMMVRYALTHDINENIRNDILEGAINSNQKSLEFVSVFSQETLKINKYGFITNEHERIYFGSIALPIESTVELSIQSQNLLNRLNDQVHNFHQIISSNSRMSVYGNEILANKNKNKEYYDFFALMNKNKVSFVPLRKVSKVKDKDLFEVMNNDETRPSNHTDGDLAILIKAMKIMDDIAIKELGNKTYFLIDPTFMVANNSLKYVMPLDVCVSNKYSNLVRIINEESFWNSIVVHNRQRIRNFISLVKAYGVSKQDFPAFIEDYKKLTEELSKYIDRSNEWGKETACRTLQNKAWIEIYQDDLIANF